MENLKPCPFCGSVAKLRRLKFGGYVVRCENIRCEAEQCIFGSEKEAVAAWNERCKQ